VRGLLKHPAFTAIAIVTLALGIGGSTSIFTVVDAALLRGLPYKSPDRLYHLWEQTPQQAYPKREFSYPDYLDVRDQSDAFSDVFAYTDIAFRLFADGQPAIVWGAAATENFFTGIGLLKTTRDTSG